jgi:hypothetical protein
VRITKGKSIEQIDQYAQHIVVPVSRDVKSFSAEEVAAYLISPRVGVLSSVDLNNQFPLEADKIEDVVLEWDLPPKLGSIQPAVTEQEPKFLLSVR